MGYTHYFLHERTTVEKWKKIIKDCEKLVSNTPKHTDSAGGYYLDDKLELSDWREEEKDYLKWEGDIDRVIGEEDICFNGFPEKLSHEPFILDRVGPGGFSFCKTARKPYDLIVCACLITYNFHSSSTIKISSDGDWEDWAPAMKFVEEVLGANYVMKFKMEVKL